MTRLLLVLASLYALGLSACADAKIEPGFQLTCNYDNGDNNSDTNCPEGTSCVNNCCVKPGEAPDCRAHFGYMGNSLEIGKACTSGCAGTSDCAGTCQTSICLSQEKYGLPGGTCSYFQSEGQMNCAFSMTPLPIGVPNGSICMQECDDRNCRRGWRCDCPTNQGGNGSSSGPCMCMPDCGSYPQVCGPGFTVLGERCNAATGLCYTASACRPNGGQACRFGTDCCSGNCCSGFCATAGEACP